jgi:hemerythrin-like domain-containing protein
MMDAVDRLRRDHAILRSKLDVLQSALTMGAETWYVLREVCFTLSRQLRDHIKREEALVAACRKAMPPKALAEVAVEHKDEPAHLRAVIRLFTTEAGHRLEHIKPALTQIIEGLRRHMDEEERELFPIFERLLREEAAASPPASARPAAVDETMTVNRIVEQFPPTRRTFERLFVNIPMEGCACLDEVAWRHGMEARELVDALEETIHSCACHDDRLAQDRHG